MSGRTLTVIAGDQRVRVALQTDGSVTMDGTSGPVHVAFGPAAGEATVTQGDRVERLFVTGVGESFWVFRDGRVFELTVEVEVDARRRKSPHQGALAAPMPATVVSIKVKPGDPVARGDTLIVLEAMKMELPVRAPAHGTVRAIHCREGELVQPGIALIELS